MWTSCSWYMKLYYLVAVLSRNRLLFLLWAWWGSHSSVSLFHCCCCCFSLNVQPKSLWLNWLPELISGGCFSNQQAVRAFNWSRQLTSVQQMVYMHTHTHTCVLTTPMSSPEEGCKSPLRASVCHLAFRLFSCTQLNGDSWSEKLLLYNGWDWRFEKCGCWPTDEIRKERC